MEDCEVKKGGKNIPLFSPLIAELFGAFVSP